MRQKPKKQRKRTTGVLLWSLATLLFLIAVVTGCGGGSDGGNAAPAVSPTISPAASPVVSPTVTPTEVGNVEITAKDADTSNPVKGVTVVLNSSTKLTDGTGKVLFQNIPIGTYDVQITKESYGSQTMQVTVIQGQTVTQACQLVVPEPASGKSNIIGYVKDSSGIPIENVIATLSKAAPGKEKASVRDSSTTDNNGRYAFMGMDNGVWHINFSNLPPGVTPPTPISVSAFGGNCSAPTATAGENGGGGGDVGGGGETKPGCIYGLVTDTGDGSPIPIAKVSIDISDAKKGIKALQETFTDERGFYEFRGLTAGNYTVTAEKENYLPKSEDVTLGEVGKEQNIELAWKFQYKDSVIRDVYFIDASEGWAVGKYLTVLHTTNGGANWNILSQNLGNADSHQTVRFVNASLGWIVGYGGISKTIDGGSNWTKQYTAQNMWGLHVFDANTAWAAGVGGNIVKTVNGGDLWTNQITTGTAEFYGLHFSDANHGWAVGTGGDIYHYNTGSWSKQTSPTAQTLCRVYFFNNSTGWIAGYDGIILHTTDGGANWVQQVTPLTDPKPRLYGIYFYDSNIGWAAGEPPSDSGGYGIILHTTDGGVNWKKQISPAEEWLNNIFFIDDKKGWVVGPSGILHTTTGGEPRH